MAHPSEALNKLNHMRFRTRLRAGSIAEVHVSRVEKRDFVQIRYNARDKKKGVINGEWTVSKTDRTPEQVEALLEEFVTDILGKEFRVVRHDKPEEQKSEPVTPPLGPATKADAEPEPPAKKPAAKKAAKAATKKAAGGKKATAKAKSKAKAKAKAKARGKQ